MSRRRLRVLAAVPAVAATAAVAATGAFGVAGTAQAATTNGASTATANLLGTLAYRGAEHPYLVGNVADARKRFGASSAQARAAQAGLTTNVDALAATLAGGNAKLGNTLAGALGLRDRDELSYAAAVLAAHAAKASGVTAAERQTMTSLDKVATSTASTLHSVAPAISVASATKTLRALDTGDLAALKAAALNQPAQFAAVEKSSAALATTLVGVGAYVASAKRLDGTTTAGDGSFTYSPAADYRAALETAFTEHVYQTGLFGQAILLTGPRSAATAAARKAEDLNTALDARLLGDIGTGTGHTQAVWNSHITGYGDYLTNLVAGRTALTKPASTLLSSYEAAITALVEKQAPSLGATALRAAYSEHVNGTLAVFRAEKANSPSVYPMALMGAMHFSDLATNIAKAQTKIKG